MTGEIQKRVAKQIVEAVRDVCGKNINFISPEGMITASTDAAREGTFHEIGKRAAAGGRVIEVTEAANFCGTQAGVNIPILHRGKVAGVVGISGEPEEVRKYAYLAQKIAVLFLRERELDLQRNSRRERMHYMIRCLIGEETALRGDFQSFLREYGLRENQRFCVVLVRAVSRGPEGRPPEQEIFRAFEESGSPLYTFFYPDEYILLLREEDRQRRRGPLSALAAFPGALQIGMGSVQPLTGLRLSWRTARLALRSLERTAGLAVYEELDLELIFGGIPEETRRLFLEKTSGPLEPEDLVFLEVYFSEERSLLRTGKRLNLHKNTVQYRLERIRRNCGYDPRKFRDAVVLYSALRLGGEAGTDD